jgi:hypothetical protein
MALSDEAAMQFGAPQGGSGGRPLSDEAAMAYARPNSPEKLRIPRDEGSFTGAVLHGASFGLSDELEAGLVSPVMYGIDKLTGRAPKDAKLGDYYDANLENIRGGLENYRKEHPVANMGGEVLGGLMDFNPEAAVGTVAKGFWPAVKTGAATGGAMGAASGAGNSEGGAWNRMKGALIGGTAGAGVGAGAPVLIPWLIGAVREAPSILSRAVAPWTKDLDNFISETAGRVLNETAGPAGAKFETAPLPGMRPTTGQATDNPGLKFLERSVEQSGPAQATAAAEARTANNQAMHDAIREVGDVEADASKSMAEAIEKAARAAKTSTRAAWKAAGVDETTGVSGTQLGEHVGDFVNGLSIAKRKDIPADVLDTVRQLADQGTTNLGEVQDLRSSVLGLLRAAARGGNESQAGTLGGLADTISDFVDNIPMPAEAQKAYETARAATKYMKEQFTQPKGVRNTLGTDRFGEDRVPVSAVADTFIRSGKGSPEALDAYLNAVDSQLKTAARPGQTAAERVAAVNEAKLAVEEGYQAARDAFAQRFLAKVSTTDRDQIGGAIVSAAQVTKFLAAHDHVVQSRLFDDAQRDLIRRIAQAADMSQRVARAGAKGGSDTYGKLSANTFLDVLIGNGASKLLPAVGTLAGHSVGGPVGAAAGFAASLKGGEKMTEALYGATRDKVIALVHEAIADPALAKTLMMQATKQNALKVPAQQRRFIYSILGYEAVKPGIDAVAQGQR